MSPPRPLVLVVEDDPVAAKLITAVIRRDSSFEDILHLGDGRDVIDYLSSGSGPMPALMILDLGMPDITGFDVLEWMVDRELEIRIPVVVFTASLDPEDARRAYSLGVRGYLEKPKGPTALAEVVREVLARWSSERTGTEG